MDSLDILDIDKNVLQTIDEMLNDRKYYLSKTNQENKELIYSKDKDNKDNKDNENIIIFFPQEKKVNIDIVKEKILLVFAEDALI